MAPRPSAPSGNLVPGLPADIAIFLAALSFPPAPFVPPEHHFAPGYAVLLVDHGDPAAHARAVEALRQAVPPMITFDTPMPYTALQQMFDDPPLGHPRL